MHRTEWMFDGHSLEPHAGRIGELFRRLEIRSALDYGCGKGRQYEGKKLHVQCDWGLMPALYDPGVIRFSTLPNGPFDAVICTDVMEHVPETLVAEVLSRIFSRATKLVYLAISTRLAVKKLPNGENAHCTVKPPEWWMARLSEHLQNQQLEVSFQGNPDEAPVVYSLNEATHV